MILAFPSLLILALLVLHSAWTLPRARAVAFWAGAVAYGLARGVGVRLVTETGLGGSFPYVIREPLLSVAGVSLQEVAGWAIVLYLGWWLGARLSPRLFVQILVAFVFLAASSLAVESAAIAAGWWRWTVPVPEDSWTGVPFIGIVDWLFSATDFLLPFLALTAPALRGRPVRYLALAAFPAHFGAHLFVHRPAALFPIPVFHAMHWTLIGVALWLAARSRIEDRPFASVRLAAIRAIPVAAIGVMVVVLAAADLMVASRPGLLAAVAPLAAMALMGALPITPLLPGGRARKASWAMAAIVALAALWVHTGAARREEELKARLDRALALREGGSLPEAARVLEGTAAEFRESHVAPAMLGEMAYRAGRLEDAHRYFTAATRIQQSYADGFRYLAVIELRRGRPGSAAEWAAGGLEIDPHDPQLRYLHARGQEVAPGPVLDLIGAAGPRQVYGLASLAFEVDDLRGASAFIEAGAARWPHERLFFQGRVRLALARGEPAEARRAARDWLEAMPQDAEARAAFQALAEEPP